MKMIFIHILIVSFLVAGYGCSDVINNSEFSDMIGKGQNYVPEKPAVVEPTLKQTKDWKIDSIDGNSVIWYHYEGGAFNSQQNVHVMELDLSDSKYKLEFVKASPIDSLSNVAIENNAIAGINATYEADASFIKINGGVLSEITIPEDHLRGWKNKGALAYNGINKAEIGYGNKASYLGSEMPNIFSGSPMLIDNYKPVGETFVGDLSGVDLNSLPAEDYRKHQGIRHPRTIVALTENNRLLMITIDGRHSQTAEGMTAKEVTSFLNQYFKPQSALNLDGGGSTTMYIRGKQPITGVVNYPCDNGKADHWGQRRVITHLLIKKTDNSIFESGSGTEDDPYIITTTKHLMNVSSVNYAQGMVYFKMDADLNMAGIDWKPLNADENAAHVINFDGNGHIIKGLKSVNVKNASLFGFLYGVVKNLGIVNAEISSETDNCGILASWVGAPSPKENEMLLGYVENCYTTGTVQGKKAAVGGIAGNIGRQASSGSASSIKNSYSTATVISDYRRAGGLVGVIYGGGILKYCHATGDVSTKTNTYVGGIVGYTDNAPEMCVALNKLVKSGSNHELVGRISGYIGDKAMNTSIKNWGVEGMNLIIVDKPKAKLNEETVLKTGYDGLTKSKDFLKDMNNYIKAGWDATIWHSEMGPEGYPILKWQYERTTEH